MSDEHDRLAQVAAAGVPDLVLLLEPDDDGLRCRYASESARDLLGVAPEQLVGQQLHDLVAEDDAQALAETAPRAASGPVTVWLRVLRQGREPLWCECSLALAPPSADGVQLVVAVFRDVSGRLTETARLESVGWTDPLTGVANRTVLSDRARHALSRLGRSATHVALVFLDLDRFKVVNDSLGHQAGDDLLIALAERLVGVVRPSDTLARLGGDEFAVLAEDIGGEQDAQVLADRLVATGRQPFLVRGQRVTCTMSAGVVVTSDPAATFETLLQAADLAMYRAKQRGRDRVEAFDERLRSVAVQRLSRERMLRTALDEHRLRVEYQPIVDLADGRLCAVEALVRIATDTEHLLLPNTFLGVARDTGLLQQVDAYVLDRTMEQGREWWRELDGLPVSRNVTSADLAGPSFADRLVELLEMSGLPASSVHLELTEHTLIEASRSALQALRDLRAAGVKVGLDDFGTGYSSLAYLRDLPLDFVKIDRSFVVPLVEDERARRVVSAVIEMCHALDLGVVAEGVERVQERDVLQDLGCERAQGWLWARSGSGDQVRSYASSHGLLTGGGTGERP